MEPDESEKSVGIKYGEIIEGMEEELLKNQVQEKKQMGTKRNSVGSRREARGRDRT